MEIIPEPAIILSIIALILSGVAILRQSIPSKYEAERRIREKFQIPNGEPRFEYRGTNYYINYITVSRNKGLYWRIKELFFRDISGETQIVFTIDGNVPEPLDVEYISTIDEEGVRALMFSMNTTQPDKLYNQFSESAFVLSKSID